MHHLLLPEASGRNALSIGAAVSIAARSDAVAEIRAGNRSFDSFGAARAIALSRTCRHVKRTSRGGVKLCALFASAFQSVGIAKASGLHFLHGGVDGRGLRASAEVSGVHQLR